MTNTDMGNSQECINQSIFRKFSLKHHEIKLLNQSPFLFKRFNHILLFSIHYDTYEFVSMVDTVLVYCISIILRNQTIPIIGDL